MANAFQCDRCREFSKGKPESTVRKLGEVDSLSDETASKSYDLCKECTRSFHQFIETVPPRPAPRSFLGG